MPAGGGVAIDISGGGGLDRLGQHAPDSGDNLLQLVAGCGDDRGAQLLLAADLFVGD